MVDMRYDRTGAVNFSGPRPRPRPTPAAPAWPRSIYRISVLLISLLLLSTPLFPLLSTGEPIQDPREGGTNEDLEPNDTLIDAVRIDLDHADIPGSIGGLDTDDFYKVQLEVLDDGAVVERLVAQISFLSGSSECSATLLDPWGFVMDNGRSPEADLQATSSPDHTGDFYVHLTCQSQVTTYQLTTTVIAEAASDQDTNNVASTAITIAPLNPYEASGDLFAEPRSTDFHDLYEFRLETTSEDRPAMVQIYMDPSDGAMFRLELYDNYLNHLDDQVDLTEPPPGQPQVLSYVSPDTGTFYLRVWAVNGTGGYDLEVYLFPIKDDRDGGLETARDIPFEMSNPHVSRVMDSLGDNTYPGTEDRSDFWRLSVTEGQFVRCDLASHHYDNVTRLPDMVINVYDDDGTAHEFQGGGLMDREADPGAGFEITAPEDGELFIEIALEGEAPGGGGYIMDVFSNRPPGLATSEPLEVAMDDNGTHDLLDLGSAVIDPEGDVLTYNTHVEPGDPCDGGLDGSISVWMDHDVLRARAGPRTSGHCNVTVGVEERDYRHEMELEIEVTVGPSNAYKVEVREPYSDTHTVPLPVVLVHNEHETDSSLDLSDIFADPCLHTLEFGIEGPDVVTQLFTDRLGRSHVQRAAVGNALVVEPGDGLMSGDEATPLHISITDAARDSRTETEVTITVRAWPFDDLTGEASEKVALDIVLRRDKGTPPVWDLPDRILMDEDTPLTMDLSEHSSDTDPDDVGNLEHTMTSQSPDLIVISGRNSSYRLVPRKDFCGLVEGVLFKVTDSYGWSTRAHVDVEVRCVADGPELVLANPSPADPVTIFAGEERFHSVVVRDVDTGPSALVYDWYVDGHPQVAGGEEGFMYRTNGHMNGTHNVTVEVTNGVTGMGLSVVWEVEICHINLPPGSWITRPGGNRMLTDVSLEAGETLSLEGHALDPEDGEMEYRWYLGDGSVSAGRTVDYVYQEPGRYTLSLKVTDGELSTYSRLNVTVRSSSNIVSSSGAIGMEEGIWFAAIVLLFTLFGLGSTQPSRYSIYFFLTLLYSKIKKTEVLDHYLRGRIQGYITANPGAHYNMIKSDLEINNGTLAYHLKVLENKGYVKSLRDGIYKRFYPMKMKVKRPPSITERILVLLRNDPGLSQGEIARRLDESRSTVNDYIRRMSRADLLRVERSGVRHRCYVNDDRRDA